MMLLLVLFALGLAAMSPSYGQELKLLHGGCPIFWYSFKGRCYKYIDSLMTWGEAEVHCLSEGANLVSIHSLEEHNFVNHLIKNFDSTQEISWIGLTDVHKEGAWMWSDGSKYNFSIWTDNEPNNANGNENCGHTSNGQNLYWNDHVCSLKIRSVCASRTVCP
ncbi:hypothetical protein ILYODFUR_035578 [Ilyodon furcidens]|uniref:C-type lectin domain-containing protein n=1 Tax=Ilyodon furcidens TaxID=33524 RepID=A0ABV0THE6_9TELE